MSPVIPPDPSAFTAPVWVRALQRSAVMTIDLPVLKCGNCEPLKMSVHAGALGLAFVCGIYNAAAWLSRRETHLAVNTVMYVALALWEHQHVAHHLAEMRPQPIGTEAVESSETAAAEPVPARVPAAA